MHLHPFIYVTHDGGRQRLLLWSYEQCCHILSHLNIRKTVTLDRNIQTPKCSRDSPPFSLTVANSNTNPSSALWKKTHNADIHKLVTLFPLKGILKRFYLANSATWAIVTVAADHLAQHPQWNVCEWREGNSKTPVRSPAEGHTVTHTA